MPATYAFGRLPSDPAQPKLRLRRSAVERPEPPASCDWLSGVREWGMLANDSVGDCTMAGAAHTAIAIDKYGQGRDTVITDREVLDAYSALTGYSPTDPNTDVGATLQEALDYWRKTGIAGNQIVAFAFLDAQDLDLVRSCIATFGSCYAGMWVPESAMAQLERGEIWQVVPRSRNLGGHCVHLGAYDEDTFSCTTWGQVQHMTVEFYLRYFDEVACPIDLDWITLAGAGPTGLDIATLNADFECLTGEPGPFPLPPPPVPPVIENPDLELVAAFARWQETKGLR